MYLNGKPGMMALNALLILIKVWGLQRCPMFSVKQVVSIALYASSTSEHTPLEGVARCTPLEGVARCTSLEGVAMCIPLGGCGHVYVLYTWPHQG